MKLKLDENNNVVVQDGKPVYDDSGRDVVFDYDTTLATISRLNSEAKGHREAKEEALEQVKAFEGIEPEAARKALNVVKNLDDKKLIDAGEVERVKQEAKSVYDDQVKAIEKQYKPFIEKLEAAQGELHQERLGTAFSRSKFINEKMAIPVDLAQSKFGNNFFFEDGKIRAKGTDGNPVYSRSNPGNLADFDEALEILVDSYSHRDSILKGTGASGSGASGSATLVNGKRSISRTVFDSMPAQEQAKAAKEMAIVD